MQADDLGRSIPKAVTSPWHVTPYLRRVAAPCQELSQGHSDSPDNLRRGGSYLGLPESENGPPHPFEARGGFAIALHVPLDLGNPVVGVGACLELPAAALPVSAMPEVSVNEDGKPSPEEDDIRVTMEGDDILPVAVPGSPEFLPENQFALGIGLPAVRLPGSARPGGGGLPALVGERGVYARRMGAAGGGHTDDIVQLLTASDEVPGTCFCVPDPGLKPAEARG